MDTLWHDVRFAIRQLLKQRTFSIITILTLALAIGANTAIFSVVYAVLLRPLPFPNPRELVGLAEVFEGRTTETQVTWDEYQFLAASRPPFASLAALTPVGFNLVSGGSAEHLGALRVSANYFHTLRVSPALGREFTAEDDQPTGPSVAIVSHSLWRRRFAADPAIIGRSVLLDGRPFTIVGVMPAGFQPVMPPTFMAEPVELWSTLAQVRTTVGSGQNLGVVGRLPTGRSLELARSELASTNAAYHREFEPRRLVAPTTHLDVVPYNGLVSSTAATPVRILFGAIAFVLLIACANVAALMLGRSMDRNREFAVRIALGASRHRVVRQLLTESLLLALASGVLGVLLAAWGLDELVGLIPDALPHAGQIRLDGFVLLFSVALALCTGVVFGLAPAWITSAVRPQGTLREGGARTMGSARTTRLRDALVIAEIALSLVLLTGAGLMMRTFGNLLRVDAGFDPHHVVSAEIWLTGTRQSDATAVSTYYAELTRRLEATPGVASAAVVEAGEPLERGGNLGAVLDGKVLPRVVWYRTVTPEYFRTLRTPVREGRAFGASDVESSQPVAIVNAEFARQFGSGQVLGHSVRLGGETNPVHAIVGVVGDVRSFVGAPAEPTVYIPSTQTPFSFTRVFGGWFPIHVLVRTSGEPAALVPGIRRVLQSVDPDVPVGRLRTMDGVLMTSLAFQRFLAMLLTMFAAIGLILAAVGVYGLLAYLVSQRTRDIGVRIALGARPRQVLRMFIARGAVLAATGCAVGVAGAFALTRLLAHQLFNVSPSDPGAFAVGTLLLAFVVLLACCIPARRAARVDPLVSLRSE